MHLHPASLVLPLVGALAPCAAAPVEARDAEPQEATAAELARPLAGLARRIPGQWRMTTGNGRSQVDTWHWGPGQHSLRALTEGSPDDGESTSGLCRVLYWHPGREELVLLGLFSEDRLAEGTVAIGDEAVDFALDFHERALPGRPRSLQLHWAFDGADRYRASLEETLGGDDPVFLAAWDYVRSGAPDESRASTGTAQPPTRWKDFGALVGRTWETRLPPTDGAGGATRPATTVRWTLAWIPFADALHARAVAPGEDGAPEPLLDAYLFRHPATGALRCLALSREGWVFEGELETPGLELDLRFELKGYLGERVLPLSVRFELEEDGTLRQRAWSADGSPPALLLDARHRELEPERD